MTQRQANKVFGLRNLSDRDVIAAARRYDLSPRERLVIESAQQADETHGKVANDLITGKVSPNWGTDSYGIYQAANLLDGYLCEETRVMRCDARAARQFERDAYGY
jgi:hypothetical protein